jgi:hypothetical protein
MKFSFLPASLLSVFVLLAGRAQAQTPVPPPNEISADLGSCSAEITVLTPDQKPVYAAKMQARIQYGLMGVKRLDLEAYTDAQGHLKITKLPEVLKKPLYIHLQKDDKEQIVTFRPETNCQAKLKVVLY